MGTIRTTFSYDAKDDFMARMFQQNLHIRDFIYKDKERLKFDDKYTPVFQNLYEAKIAREKCNSLLNKHLKDVSDGTDGIIDGGLIRVNNPIDNELNLFFKDFFIRGRITLQCLVKLAGFIGYNIGHAFADPEKYLKKKEKFLKDNPDPRFLKLAEMIDIDRRAWYSTFAKMRNLIEHDGLKLPDIEYVIDRQNKTKIILPRIESQSIEEILDILWFNIFRFCEDIVVFLLSLKLADPFIIIEVPKEHRDPQNPARFQVTMKNLPPELQKATLNPP